MTEIKINGFLPKAKLTAGKKLYCGRFTCPDVQWTGNANDLIATFTITAEELADAAESGMIWTDQDVQRGIVPGVSPLPNREISLTDGYPDTTKYIFNSNNADDIVEKLLGGQKLFLNPLIWNLRPGAFEAFWDSDKSAIYLYTGKIYLPDSHHRHQAIVKAVRLWRETPREFAKFSGDKQFKIELYFLTREDEGNYFYDKNNRATPTAKSKGYDLTTLDDLSLLAKKAIEHSSALQGNVNRVTDRLTNKNPQVITLSTLREMMKSFSSSMDVDLLELDGMAKVAAAFYDKLALVRPELGILTIQERKNVRDTSIVDSAVMMHGYGALIKSYNEDLAKKGTVIANREWDRKLALLSSQPEYYYGDWHGDLFSKSNPLWQAIGVVKPGRLNNKLTVLNTGGARSECGRTLKQLINISERPRQLDFLGTR